MTYNQILKELESVDLSSEFDKEMKQKCSISIYKRVNENEKIHSTGSLIRHLISYYEYNSERWLFWQKVLIYFMTPDFVRVKNF